MVKMTVFFFAVAALVAATHAKVLLNCGGKRMSGTDWMGDSPRFRSNSKALSYKVPGPISAPGVPSKDVPIFKTHCFAPYGDLVYMLPIRGNEKYTVKLYFAETWPGSGRGVRLFYIKVNSQKLMKPVDIFKRANGLNKGITMDFSAMPEGGYITVSLLRVPGHNNPFISGISIEPATVMQNPVVV